MSNINKVRMLELDGRHKDPPTITGSNLHDRIISSIVLGCIGLFAINEGGFIFSCLVIVAANIVLYEWLSLIKAVKKVFSWRLLIASIAGLLFSSFTLKTFLIVGTPLIVFSCWLVANKIKNRNKRYLAFTGVFYAVLPMAALLSLRNEQAWGFEAIVWILLVVVSTDTCAYFSGKTFGGPKLAPAISPKKTWSGLLGGMAGAMLVSLLFTSNFSLLENLPLMLFAMFLAVAAQMGDLFESSLKRRFNVKDSGNLIPGHGGLMDRLDGLLAACVVAWLIGFIRNMDNVAAGVLIW